MRNELLNKMLSLRQSKTPFALASIVRRKAPTSGKPGDHAIITEDGQIHGWIGGGCTRGIVLKESLLAIQDRKSRFVSIRKNALTKESSFPHTKVYSMTCQSGGEVEVYIEPIMPKPHIIIFGTSHIGRAVCEIAKVMDYQVTAVMAALDASVYPKADQALSIEQLDKLDELKGSYVVVCSQGDGDIPSLLKALSIDFNYLGLVASRMKANGLFSELRQHGIKTDQLTQIKTPAGLDIQGKTAEEAAVSIIAEIVQIFRADTEKRPPESKLDFVDNQDFYVNPVCNIPIQKSTAKHVIQYAGESVYFCCDGCKVSFEKDPDKYMAKSMA